MAVSLSVSFSIRDRRVDPDGAALVARVLRHTRRGRRAREHPAQACIVFVKHESTWETLFVQTLFAPQATIVKKELLNIPFFGWAFRLLRPIAIDRADPRGALRTLNSEGTARLEHNIWVVLFPEGTRVPIGESRSFQIGGAALAESERPIGSRDSAQRGRVLARPSARQASWNHPGHRCQTDFSRRH